MRSKLPNGGAGVRSTKLWALHNMGCPFPRALPTGNTQVVGMSDIVDGKIVDSGWSLVLLDQKERKKFLLNEGDLLLNRTNSLRSLVSLTIWDRIEDAVFASYIVRYAARYQIAHPKFTLAALSISRSEQQIERLVTRAISQANINPSAFYNDVEIALPPLPEQRRIVAALEAWEQSIDQTQRLIAPSSGDLMHPHPLDRNISVSGKGQQFMGAGGVWRNCRRAEATKCRRPWS